MLKAVYVARYDPGEDVSQTVDWVRSRLTKLSDMGVFDNLNAVFVSAVDLETLNTVTAEHANNSLIVLPGYNRNWVPRDNSYPPVHPVPPSIQARVNAIIARASVYGIPLFGICGGFQAIADHLHPGSLMPGGVSGGRVFVSNTTVGGWEASFDHGYSVSRDISSKIAQPYYYHLTDPGAIVLSAALFTPRIAGVQFHPEWDPSASGCEVSDELLSYVLYDANLLKESA